ncbi:Chaperone protein dnaJ 49 [Cardamine amara subsp. amara]|uniref:Chaperone protein dnaJ 49 n=1 Tax=Cardamine amara subsp. amara TaxID=228776 RepID=A0ABD1AIS5_CARAN
MDCNKDEAKRAMDIAERKITEKDYNGAKKFVNKAQNLFPNLDGLKQLLTTVEVYISGENKLAGEPDWYGILGVDPLATDLEVRKKYLKLALMLHPDKNRFKGAEGAFKLLSDAWGLLSDTDRRYSYNEMIRKIYGTQPNVPTTESAANPPPHQPTPFYRSEPVVESRPKPKPRGRPPKSSMDKTNATQPTTQSAADPPPPPHQPTPSVGGSRPKPKPKPRGRPPKSSVDKTNATQPTVPPPQSAANPPPPPPPHQPTPSVGGSRPKPKPKPRGRPPKSSVDKTNATQPTTQSAADPPAPPPHQSTPFCRYEPVILERRPNPRGREGESSGVEEKDWVVKRRLVKRSDRRVRTTP